MLEISTPVAIHGLLQCFWGLWRFSTPRFHCATRQFLAFDRCYSRILSSQCIRQSGSYCTLNGVEVQVQPKTDGKRCRSKCSVRSDHAMHFAGIVNMYVEIVALIPCPKCTRKYNKPCLTRLPPPDLTSSASNVLVTVLAGTFGPGETTSGNTTIEEFVQHGERTASVVGYEEVDNNSANGAETGEEEGSLDAPFGSGVGAQQVR